MARNLSDVEVYRGEKMIACYELASWTRAKRIADAALKRWQGSGPIFIRSHHIWHNADPEKFGYRL